MAPGNTFIQQLLLPLFYLQSDIYQSSIQVSIQSVSLQLRLSQNNHCCWSNQCSCWVFSTCSRQIYSHILEHNYIYPQYITVFFLLCIRFKTYKQHMDSRCRAHHKETPNHLRSRLQFVHCHLLPGFSNHNQTTSLMHQSQIHKGNAFAINIKFISAILFRIISSLYSGNIQTRIVSDLFGTNRWTSCHL